MASHCFCDLQTGVGTGGRDDLAVVCCCIGAHPARAIDATMGSDLNLILLALMSIIMNLSHY